MTMDMHEVAATIIDEVGKRVRVEIRQVKIESVQDDGTVTMTVAGSTVPVSGIESLSSVAPAPDDTGWIIANPSRTFTTSSADVILIGTQGSPPFATLTVDAKAAKTLTPLEQGPALALTPEPAGAMDKYGMWSADQPSRLACVSPGVYALFATAAPKAPGMVTLRLMVDGICVARHSEMTDPGEPVAVTAVWPLTLGDYVELSVSCDEKAMALVPEMTRLTVQWLRGVLR